MKTLVCNTCEKTFTEDEQRKGKGGCPYCGGKSVGYKQYYQLRFLLAPKYKYKVSSNSESDLPPQNLTIWDTERNVGRNDFDKNANWCSIYAESMFKVELLNSRGEQIAMFFPETSDYKHWLNSIEEAIPKAINSYASRNTRYIYERASRLYDITFHYDDPNKWLFRLSDPPPVAKVEYIDDCWIVFIRNPKAKYGDPGEWSRKEQ